jgi:hypothetical protein
MHRHTSVTVRIIGRVRSSSPPKRLIAAEKPADDIELEVVVKDGETHLHVQRRPPDAERKAMNNLIALQVTDISIYFSKNSH